MHERRFSQERAAGAVGPIWSDEISLAPERGLANSVEYTSPVPHAEVSRAKSSYTSPRGSRLFLMQEPAKRTIVHSAQERQGTQRANQRRQHVPLRIPHVALRSKERVGG